MSYRNHAGQTSGRFEEKVTQEVIDRFSSVVGYGSRSGCPPTFLTRWRHGEFKIFEKLGVNLESVLHGEQEYHYSKPIVADQIYVFETVLTSIREKKGKDYFMAFLQLDTEITEKNSAEEVAFAKSIIVIRKKVS